MQLITRKLKKVRSTGFSRSGADEDRLKAGLRTAPAGVVVSNATLFGDGACACTKDDLRKDYDQPTIVRSPSTQS